MVLDLAGLNNVAQGMAPISLLAAARAADGMASRLAPASGIEASF